LQSITAATFADMISRLLLLKIENEKKRRLGKALSLEASTSFCLQRFLLCGIIKLVEKIQFISLVERK
jgi:hypothetical protein